MRDKQAKTGVRWVPLAEAPFKLRFGWERPDEDEGRPGGTQTFGNSFGWVSIYRTPRNYFFIECRGIDDTVRAAFPIGDYAYLGADARLSAAEIAAQGDLINPKRIQDAIETAVRLAVLERQLGLRARKSLDGPFADIPPSAVPELKFTNWRKGWGEYSTGERLFDIQTCILKPSEADLDHTVSRRLLMTINPMALSRIRPENRDQSAPAPDSALIVPSEAAPNKEHRDEEARTKKPPRRPRGSGYQRVDAPLIDEMRALLEKGILSSPSQAADRLASKAAGNSTYDSKKGVL